MVDEYLSEREQAEQLRNWLRENWIWLVAGVALTLGGYFGFRWWESREASRSIEAGERFAAMLDAIGGGKREEGQRIADELTGQYADTPYADQATLVLAQDRGRFGQSRERWNATRKGRAGIRGPGPQGRGAPATRARPACRRPL